MRTLQITGVDERGNVIDVCTVRTVGDERSTQVLPRIIEGLNGEWVAWTERLW